MIPLVIFGVLGGLVALAFFASPARAARPPIDTGDAIEIDPSLIRDVRLPNKTMPDSSLPDLTSFFGPNTQAPPSPGPEQIAFAKRMARVLRTGDRINSWWRSPEVNDAAKGKSKSRHLLGLGMDIDRPGGSETQVALGVDIFEVGATAQVNVKSGSSYVHAQDRPLISGSRVQVLRDDRVDNLA